MAKPVPPDQENDRHDQETPLHWSSMLGWLAWILGRAHQRYRSGATATQAIEHAMRVSMPLPPIEIAARVVWAQMTSPVTDPAQVALWIAALAEGDVQGIAKA